MGRISSQGCGGQRQPEDILAGLRWSETLRGYPRRAAVARNPPRISSRGCGGQRQPEDILAGLRWPETARGYPRGAAVARDSPTISSRGCGGQRQPEDIYWLPPLPPTPGSWLMAVGLQKS